MRTGLQPAEIVKFRRSLLAWYRTCQRDLPWRRTRDPYAIWLSETMLQQTRVTTVIPYYEKFLQLFPSVQALAEAPEADLLTAWAGLGYYRRARNLQKAAQSIAASGSFPATHQAIRALPGVGNYTSAAVASIAFNLPHAAVDGNVLRVLSRVCADGADIGTATGQKHFLRIAQQLLSKQHPSSFNQGMMELGAMLCLPRNPQCLLCPVNSLCRARQHGTQQQFPVKAAKQKTVEEQRTLYWIQREAFILVWQRPVDSSLMPGFWELPESVHVPGLVRGKHLGSFRHGITFHNYRFEVAEAAPPQEIGRCQWVAMESLPSLPMSTVFRKALQTVRNAQAQDHVREVN